MWFAYIDESKEAGKLYVYSALVIDAEKWGATFAKVKAFRQSLRDEHGIYLSQEMHAWKFAAGKGRVADRPVYKEERAEIFRKVMRFIASSRSFAVLSSCNAEEEYAFERFLNRINRTAEAKKQSVMLLFDQGEEAKFVRRVRKLKTYNPIPSSQGAWSGGSRTKNIPLSNVIEDPVFRDSKSSYIIQLVDFCAYALMRMERPIPSRTALGYDTMYEELRPVTRRFTNPHDPRGMGIIR